jgi:hypothetical protein
MKDQREGSCTSFWEATTEVLKQLHEFVAPPEVEVMYSRPLLTYVDQRIPSRLGMPPYERATTFDDTIAVLQDPKKWEYYDKSDTSIDSTKTTSSQVDPALQCSKTCLQIVCKLSCDLYKLFRAKDRLYYLVATQKCTKMRWA